MPRPIDTEERFCRALAEVCRRGFVFRLVSTPRTEQMRLPRDLHRFASIYHASPQTSLWGPMEMVSKVLYKPKLEVLPADAMGMPRELAQRIGRACHPYDGYSLGLRRTLLEATDLW